MYEEVFERIDHLMHRQKKKQKDLDAYLGLTHSTYDNWKRGTSKSFMHYIDRIAEFLSVSPNYLICGRDELPLRDKQADREEKLLEMFRSLNEKDADTLLKIAEVFAEPY